MADKNKYQRSVTHTNPLAKDSVSLPGDAGVFGANPAPGFDKYPETKGNVLPLKKFADVPPSKPMTNKVERNRATPTIPEAMGLKQPTQTTIIQGKNRYNSSVKSSTTGKNKI